MLFGGLYLSYKFFRELVRRTTGVPVEAPFVASMFAVGVVATALRRVIGRPFKALRPGSPSIPDAMLVIAVPAAMIRRTTGVRVNDTPLVSAAIGFSLIAPAFGAIAALLRMLPAAFAAVRRLATGRP
jgi:hypothetical protein